MEGTMTTVMEGVENTGITSDDRTHGWPNLPDFASILSTAPSHITINRSDDLWSQISAFYHAVNWSETWLQSLLACHILLFCLIIRYRYNFNYTAGIFFILLAIIYSAQWINTYLMNHWQEFATQPYFESNGLFISVVLSGPLLVMALLQLLFMVGHTSSALIIVKRAELRANRKKQNEEINQSSGDTSTTAPVVCTDEKMKRQ